MAQAMTEARLRHWMQQLGPRLIQLSAGICRNRHQAEEIREAEIAKTFAGVDGLSPEHAEKVEAMTKALVKKLLHDPTKALRERKDESFTQAARELFRLDD